MIECILDGETRSFGNGRSQAMECLLEELDDNVSPQVEEYLSLKKQIHKIQEKLVECVERRERLNQTEHETKYCLRRQIPSKRCSASSLCGCIHRDSILIDDPCNGHGADDEDDEDGLEFTRRVSVFGADQLREQLVLLGQDIFTRSGLIRKQQREGMCLLRVFVGSELITWMVR